MNRRERNMKVLVYILVFLVALTALFLGSRTLNAQGEADSIKANVMSGQLDQIIKNQQLIMDKLLEMQKELQIVKIRASVKR